jgi:hypothetical protein
MYRRQFLKISSGSLVFAFLPWMSCRSSDPELNRKISQPFSLSIINDVPALKKIGNSYLKKFPLENQEFTLVDLLLTDTNGKNISSTSDSLVLQQALEEKIKKDFENGKTVVLQGWVLSITEARQCALFSLTQN